MWGRAGLAPMLLRSSIRGCSCRIAAAMLPPHGGRPAPGQPAAHHRWARAEQWSDR